MFIYFDNRVKSARKKMGPAGTEIMFGLVIVLICPLMNWLQYQLFFLCHKMVGVYPTHQKKKDFSQLNGLIIFDAHSCTSDGKLFPFGWQIIMAKVFGYTLYVLPFLCIFMSIAATSPEDDPTKSFIAPLQMNANALLLVFVAIWVSLIVLSLLEQAEHPGKWHNPAKFIITMLFCMSTMIIPGVCSNISNMKLVCLMNSNQEVCAEIRSEITCNTQSNDNIGFQYTTEGNNLVEKYFLNATGSFYFNNS